ncbi:MAG: hypothetical protein JNK49_06715, partial [Planctomycetes bacterium]|nr:hypothetical protein [Planctomycetota bacterium]
PVGAASQVGNPFGWKAVRIDPETGLLYMRHRYYAPQWGRFLTQDPLGLWGDLAGMGNGYQYGANTPLVASDPMGLQVAGREGSYRYDSASGHFLRNGQLGIAHGGGVAPLGGVGPDPRRYSNPWDEWGKINKIADANGVVTGASLRAFNAASGEWENLTPNDVEWVNHKLREFREAATAVIAALGAQIPGLALSAAMAWAAAVQRMGSLAPPARPCPQSSSERSGVVYPGADPAKAPKGFEWRGRPGSKPGTKGGNYYNPRTGESLRPDLDHPEPIGPHWDYRDSSGNWFRIFPDGRMVQKS